MIVFQMVDQYTQEIAKYISYSISGDNNQIQFGTKKIQEQMEFNPSNFCFSLIYIIQKEPQLQSISLVLLDQFIRKSWQKISPDIQTNIMNSIFEFPFHFTDMRNIAIITNIILAFVKDLGNTADLRSILNPNPTILLFQLSLLNSISHHPEMFSIFFQYSEECKAIILHGLNQSDWNHRTISINIFIILSNLLEGQLSDQLSIILSFARESLKEQEDVFISFWNSISSILEQSEITDSQLYEISQSSLLSYDVPNLSPIAKMQALIALSYKFDKIAVDLMYTILDKSFLLSIEILENGKEYPEALADIFFNAINATDVEKVYSFIHKKMLDSLNLSESYVSVVVFLIKSLMKRISNQVRDDWEDCIKLISKISCVQDSLVAQLICEFISSLTNIFEKQILESNMFLEFTVPLLASPLPELRHHARNAIYTCIDSISVPFHGLVNGIWQIASQVSHEVNPFMTLLAKAILKEGESIDSNLLRQITEYTKVNLQNVDTLVGALSISTVLLLNYESTHQYLLEPAFNAIKMCLSSDQDELIINCLFRLQYLIPMFSDVFDSDFYQRIDWILTNEELSAQIRENALLCASSIARIIPDQGLVQHIFDACIRWGNSKEQEMLHSALTAMSRISTVLSKEMVQQICVMFCEIAVQSPDEEIVTDCAAFIEVLLKDVGEPAADAGRRLSEAFLANGLKICSGKSKPDISLLISFVSLMCNLLKFNGKFCREIFAFAKRLVETRDNKMINFALDLLIEGVENRSFENEEVGGTVSLCMCLVEQKELDQELVQNLSFLATKLIQNGILNDEQIQNIYIWSNHWLCALAGSKKTMRESLSNLTFLQWVIVVMHKSVINFDAQIFAQTFEHFPPKQTDETRQMCQLIMSIAQDNVMRQAFSIQIIDAIARLLAIPTLMMNKRLEPSEVNKLGQLLNVLVKSTPNSGEVLEKVVGNSEEKRAQIQQFFN